MWGQWWVWIAAGFGLGVLEMLIPAYVFLGFALGAVVIGLALGMGLLSGSLPMLLLAFALCSLAIWAVIRLLFGKPEGQVKIWHRDIND